MHFLFLHMRKCFYYNIKKFLNTYIFFLSPGQSAYNIVEHRMAPLSHDLAGLILPHDYYGSHLNDWSVTINLELEKMNFRKEGILLAERWNKTKIDGFPCYAEYINPPVTSDDERRLVDVKVVMDSLLKQ